jgi:polysaccharide pyruvyl transferase WcaK-like protein
MGKVLNLHRVNTENIGDIMCAPYLYFPDILGKNREEILGFTLGDQPDGAKRLEFTESFLDADTIVVGGGGLLQIEFFNPAFDYIAKNKRNDQKIIMWGAGHNNWIVNDWRKLKQNININSNIFDLIGIRDDGHPFHWVPCVSCMHPIFDKRYSIVRKYGLYVHEGSKNVYGYMDRLPKNIEILDNASNFEQAIEFLAGCELVLTDSFHGAYWATLLGRKVVAFPTSSKFYDLRHSVPLCAPEDWKRSAKLARSYWTALDECRAANLDFSKKVAALIAR